MSDVLQKPADRTDRDGHLDPAGFDQNVRFRIYPAPPELAPFIYHFWTIAWERTGLPPYVSEQVQRRPYVDVFISEAESGVQCTFRNRRDYVAAGKGRIIGARFLPGAFHAFWHWSMTGLHDQRLELERVFPEANEQFIKYVLSLEDEAAIAKMIELISTKHPVQDANIELVNKVITIAENKSVRTVKDVAKKMAKSERWVQQLFQEYVGVGIKWLLQRNRLLEAAEYIRQSESPNWVKIAYELDYSSQQHFISDFKRVLGKTPRQYKRELNHTAPSIRLQKDEVQTKRGDSNPANR
ncbi:MAG TPA: helix-turn-helix transcriptional regulator [Candidatus Saccharimonadales bacterium]